MSLNFTLWHMLPSNNKISVDTPCVKYASKIFYIFMMTSLNGNIFCVTRHLCGEFTGHRWTPRTKVSDAELWCFLWTALSKRLGKQSCGWWFKTQSHPSWRHCNVMTSSAACVMTTKCYVLSCSHNGRVCMVSCKCSRFLHTVWRNYITVTCMDM